MLRSIFKAAREEVTTESSQKRRSFDPADRGLPGQRSFDLPERRVHERRSVGAGDRRAQGRGPFGPAERRVHERRSSNSADRQVPGARDSSMVNRPRPAGSIADLFADYPSLSAFVENQIVLGRSARDIAHSIGGRFGLKVSGAAVTAYRHHLEWTETRAVEQTFEESRQDIRRLIDEMETDGGAFLCTIAAFWQAVRRWIAARAARGRE